MDDFKHHEDFLHAIVKEFLETVEYSNTLEAYEDELNEHDMSPNDESLPSPLDEKCQVAKDDISRMLQLGNYNSFWQFWDKHIPKSIQEENDTQRLIFNLQLYFAVFPMLEDDARLSPVETSMANFKKYLESNGAALSQTTEFITFYALPYVESPKNHPAFKVLFENEWKEEIQSKLTLFLDSVLCSDPLPYLYKLNKRASEKNAKEQEEKEKELENLKEELKQTEDRASSYFQKFAKLQGDYHNLIGIAAELVDSLEKCVRGQMITPEYLQDICERLFADAMKKEENLDLTVPGTASSMLRASISMGVGANNNSSNNLNFNVIQNDLSSAMPASKKALLLQALTWRLTKATGQLRDSALSSYITHDVLGCTSGALPIFIDKIFESKDDIVTEYFLRFTNVLASFTDGRQYLSQSEGLLRKLIRLLMKSQKTSRVSENVLGTLQKLSLRRSVQTMLIDSAVVEWLFSVLEDPDELTDYSIEYAVALLMNLCLRTSGKKRCCFQPKKILKLLSDLLGFDNIEIRPYINGTLYSVLSLPSMRETAISMGYEDVLNAYLLDPSYDERQIHFIIKQLNTDTPKSDNDVETDGENDEEDDEEGDAVEGEINKEESINARVGEQEGEELLRLKYTNSFSSTPSQRKKPAKKIKSSLNIDVPFTRPMTPASKPGRSSFNDAGAKKSTQESLPRVSLDRPRTSSSKGARKTPTDEAVPKNGETKGKSKPQSKTYMKGFTSRPKIPRTPDIHSNSSRPTSSDVPPLTRSISPSRPDSGRGSKPGSRGSNSNSSR